MFEIKVSSRPRSLRALGDNSSWPLPASGGTSSSLAVAASPNLFFHLHVASPLCVLFSLGRQVEI